MNSLLRNAQSQQRAPHPTPLIHPDDAAASGVADGELVEISGASGGRAEPAVTTARAECTKDIRPGTVSLPHGWAMPFVNALTSNVDDIDPLTGMPLYSNLAVSVRGVHQ